MATTTRKGRSVAKAEPAKAVPAKAVADDSIAARFQNAVTNFVEKARRDPYLIAVILGGSASYDTVWEKSDIDLVVVTRDETARGPRTKENSFALIEHGLNIHAMLLSRAEFRKVIDGSVRGTFMHSFLSRSKLLFTRDETIRELYEGTNLQKLGSRDRQYQLLRAGAMTLPALYKAQKWFTVKKDLDYAFLYILYCVQSLAQVEVALADEIAGREVIQQALKLNPDFFGPIYHDLINRKKDAATVEAALQQIDQYLSRKIRTLFEPVLEFLREAGSPRSAGEIENHFKNNYNLTGGTAVMACEWLADKDVIAKVTSPARLTQKSRVEFDEMAFYYDGEEA
jgi:hypothetical protein